MVVRGEDSAEFGRRRRSFKLEKIRRSLLVFLSVNFPFSPLPPKLSNTSQQKCIYCLVAIFVQACSDFYFVMCADVILYMFVKCLSYTLVPGCLWC